MNEDFKHIAVLTDLLRIVTLHIGPIHLTLYSTGKSLRVIPCEASIQGSSNNIRIAIKRLVTGARHCNHITPVLRQLHWRRVRQRVEYKVACLVHQSLAGQTPAYIADDIQLVMDSDRRQLRSAAARTCLVPWTQNNFGDRSFGAAGPRVWNSSVLLKAAPADPAAPAPTNDIDGFQCLLCANKYTYIGNWPFRSSALSFPGAKRP